MPESGSGGNSLLDRFPAGVRERLEITDRRYDTHVVVSEADELPRWAYFPHFGTVVSLTRSTKAGGWN